MSEPWKQEFVTYLEESTSATPLTWQALAVKEQNLPARIYKYRCDNSYTRTNLESNCVWTCSPTKYNDPYDSWLSMPSNVLAQLLERSLEKKTGNAKKYSGGISQVALNTAQNLKIFRDLAKVCSFSEVHDSILMWSHYSDHHRGLCIEYDLSPLRYHHAFRRNLYPVFYSADLYDLTKFAEALAGPGQNFRQMMPLLQTRTSSFHFFITNFPYAHHRLSHPPGVIMDFRWQQRIGSSEACVPFPATDFGVL